MSLIARLAAVKAVKNAINMSLDCIVYVYKNSLNMHWITKMWGSALSIQGEEPIATYRPTGLTFVSIIYSDYHELLNNSEKRSKLPAFNLSKLHLCDSFKSAASNFFEVV